MNRFVRRLSALIVGPCLIVLTTGCRGEVPKPSVSQTAVSPAAASPPNTSSVENVTVTDAPFELEPEFSLLTRSDFESFGAEPDTWTPTKDGIVCSGKPKGYLYSQKAYQNFTLRLEYRFPRPASLKDDAKFKGNTGFLVYITGEHKLWPSCIEIQGKYVQMAALKENGGTPPRPRSNTFGSPPTAAVKENGDAPPMDAEDDDAARQKARKPVGEWNALEIGSNAGALNVSLNGTPISHSKAGTLNEGLIGIQAEDHPFEVRRMRIRSE